MGGWLIYGANGYTGSLIAREAAARGWRPQLAGRNSAAVVALAQELGLESRVFSLDEASEVDRGLRDAAVVLHCAGPFVHTAKPMADACLRNKAHYLDITGEAPVFQALAERDAEAKAAGILFMPGVGFDVVPTDCLAAHLKAKLPGATHLTLALLSQARVSRGTARTMVEHMAHGGLVRRNGVLTRVPAAWKTRTIDFGGGPRRAMTIPWGDVVTAYHSTGIPNIEVYLAVPRGTLYAARASRYLGWLLGSKWMQNHLKKRIQAGPPGPSAAERRRGRTVIWGEVRDEAGHQVCSRLECPDGYTLTVDAALAVVERVMAGEAPVGFHTPAQVFGADFVLAVNARSVVRIDLGEQN